MRTRRSWGLGLGVVTLAAALLAAICVDRAGLGSSATGVREPDSSSREALERLAPSARQEARGAAKRASAAHASPVELARAVEGPLPPTRVIVDPRHGEIAEGEILVAAQAGRADEIEMMLGSRLRVRAMARLPRSGLLRVRLEDGVELAAAIETARSLDGVDHAAPNAIVRGSDQMRERAGARSGLWNISAIHLPVHELARGADGRASYVVALLDSGVALRAHVHEDGRVHGASPALASVDIVAPFDAIDGDATPDDENGHGTFLANLLVGAPGLARGAALMPVRVLDGDLIGTEAALIEGLAHARDQGADVVNLSLVLDRAYLPTRLLDAAIAETLASGVVIVAAAGNDGEPQVRYPAAFQGVVAVGASTPSSGGALTRAWYSSHGAALDVLAPGGDLSVDANGDGWPDGIVAETFGPATPERFEPWLYAGTSQAAAHASAAALRLLSTGADPGAIPGRLRTSARGGRFDPGVGGGHLDVAAALERSVELPRVGVQALVVLRDLGDGSRAAIAPLAVLDASDVPVPGARILGRFRGSVEAISACTTARDGTCTLEAGPLLDGSALVALEIEAIVLRDGRAVRPATLTSSMERDVTLAATDGAGLGSSSTIWSINPSLLTFSGALTTYFVYGSGAGSALAPTFIAFDQAVADALRAHATSGAGDGAPLYFLAWRPESFLGTWSSGGGLGSSSTNWSGWSFQWLGWGSSVYTVFGAHEGRVSAR